MIPSRPSSIDDLPEALQVEILCRISCRKSVFRCTSVSKHWSTLISDPDFGRRYVRRHGRVAHRALIASCKESNIFIPLLEESRTLDLNLNFMHPRETIVVATCNDLVLCFPSDRGNYDFRRQREFYIYNPFTKESFALPPASHTYNFRYDNVRVGMGFICEYQNPSGTDGIDQYRWSVVRFGLASCHMDIFSSETGEWRDIIQWQDNPELQPLLSICHRIYYIAGSTAGIACNGRLYWVVRPDYTAIEVDPFNVTVNLFNLPFQNPEVLGKQGGYLRCCEKWVEDDINVWELKEEEDETGCKSKRWCSVVSGVSLAQMVSESKDPLITHAPFWSSRKLKAMVLGFDPNNEHVLCLNFINCIAKCNFHARTLERIAGDYSVPEAWGFSGSSMVNQLVLPYRVANTSF